MGIIGFIVLVVGILMYVHKRDEKADAMKKHAALQGEQNNLSNRDIKSVR